MEMKKKSWGQGCCSGMRTKLTHSLFTPKRKKKVIHNSTTTQHFGTVLSDFSAMCVLNRCARLRIINSASQSNLPVIAEKKLGTIFVRIRACLREFACNVEGEGVRGVTVLLRQLQSDAWATGSITEASQLLRTSCLCALGSDCWSCLLGPSVAASSPTSTTLTF